MIDEWVNRNAEQIDFGDMLSDSKYDSSDLCFCLYVGKVQIVLVLIIFQL